MNLKSDSTETVLRTYRDRTRTACLEDMSRPGWDNTTFDHGVGKIICLSFKFFGSVGDNSKQIS